MWCGAMLVLWAVAGCGSLFAGEHSLSGSMDLEGFDRLAFQTSSGRPTGQALPAPSNVEVIEAEESAILAPNQPGNIRSGAGQVFEEGPGANRGPVLDPNQVGNASPRKRRGREVPVGSRSRRGLPVPAS